MPSLLKISINDGPGFIQALRTKPARVVSVIYTKLNALLFVLQSKIVGEKLSGQVLHRRTGVLASSVRVIPAKVEGSRIVGGIEAGGAAAMYAAVHEYGGSHAYPILATKARALAFVSHGKQVFAKSVMHPPAAARPFMSTALAESAESITTELQAAINGAIAEGK